MFDNNNFKQKRKFNKLINSNYFETEKPKLAHQTAARRRDRVQARPAHRHHPVRAHHRHLAVIIGVTSASHRIVAEVALHSIKMVTNVSNSIKINSNNL